MTLLEFKDLKEKKGIPDSEIYGSCCVVPIEGGNSRFEKTAKLSKGAKTIQDAINEVLDGRGTLITPRAGMPTVRAVKVTDVRGEFDRRYVTGEADPEKAKEAKRKAFKRALDTLSLSQYAAGESGGADWIWRLT